MVQSSSVPIMSVTFKEYVYRVTSPSGKEFYAATIFVSSNKVYVISTRNGMWELEPVFRPEDLATPIYEFNEWDVVKIDPDNAPPRPKPEDLPLLVKSA